MRWVIAFGLIIIFLSSCTHISTPDGPPNYYVDETKIPNAVPQIEPLSAYGNMPSYTVFGKRYYPLHNARNYEETGIASWYGTKFHSRRTSSGEAYSMIAMTAAHKTLPLPSYVEVTNLQNHRRIIVKVNDRGPFSQNRIIDLSYVAAKKLDMLKKGTARVKIRVLDPTVFGKSIYTHYQAPPRRLAPVRIAKAKAPVYSAKPSAIYLQVGAFKNKLNAVKLKQRLISLLKTPVDVTIPTIHSSFYKVRVGPIEDVAIAESLIDRLRSLGFKPDRLGK